MSIKIGIIGAGANTRIMHIPKFKEIEGVEITAVCNRSRESGEKAAKEFDIPHVFDDWKELVHSDIDAICIGTWPYMHCPITLEALAAGKHVLTEARMSMDVNEAQQMLDASKKSDKVSMIVPAPMWLEYETEIIKKINAGYFGDFMDINITMMRGAYNPSDPIHWRHQKCYSGLNIMALGIFNELSRRYFGDEKSISALGKVYIDKRHNPETGKDEDIEIYDSVSIIADMKSGAHAVYHLSNVTSPGEVAIEAFGTKASFKLSDKAYVAENGEKEWKALEVSEENRGGWRVEKDFIEAIRDGREITHTNFDDGIKYMKFIEAVHKSIETRQSVDLF